MEVSEYAAHDGVGLTELVRSRQVSHEEVLDAAQRAVAEVDDELNALVAPCFDEPLAYERGPLAGVPFLIKDLGVQAAGIPQDAGSRMIRDHVPDRDTELMQRFRRAGFATLGRTATPEFGFCATTEPRRNGPTRNPWKSTHMVGGSSGGSAAMVAAGAVPIAHANDGGGSIRIPASCCGLVGLKPTRGRTSLGPDVGELLNGMAIEFVVTRTVRDAAVTLDAVHGAGVGDKYEIAPPPRPYANDVNTEPGALRIAVSTRSVADVAVDPECIAAAEAVATMLESLGHDVTVASPSYDPEAFHHMNVAIWSATLAWMIDGMAQVLGVDPTPENLEATTWACLEHGRSLSAVEWLSATATFNGVSRSIAGFFTRYDVLLTPTIAVPPQELGHLDADDPTLDADGWTRANFTFAPFTSAFNVSGNPAISLPLGSSSDGLPIGIQLAARYGDESTLFRLAGQLEEAMSWSDRRPPIYAGA